MVFGRLALFVALFVVVNCLPTPSHHHSGWIEGYEHHVVKIPVKVLQEHHYVLRKLHVPILRGRYVHEDPHHYHVDPHNHHQHIQPAHGHIHAHVLGHVHDIGHGHGHY